MLEFKPIQVKSVPRLRKYYSRCDYRLCEYSAGVKLMWRQHWRPSFAESHGCLVVLNQSHHLGHIFDYPVPLPGVGDVDAALDDIDEWCQEHAMAPIFGVVPAEEREHLLERYPYTVVDNDRLWQDYLYRAEDLMTFAGRRYSGQRNHIKKFRTQWPNASFRRLTAADCGVIEQFWKDYEAEFPKSANAKAVDELTQAKRMLRMLDRNYFVGGGIFDGDKLIALSLAEQCGDTLIIHIEKALYSYTGVYPTLVQAFADAFGGDKLLSPRHLADLRGYGGNGPLLKPLCR